MENGQTADLALLIHFIAEIEAVERIRFMTSHPVEFSQNLIDAYATVPKLASHLHLPVQHGSDKILSAMKRNHTILEFKQKIRKLRAVRPDITISSDFIVAFPGETEDDFKKLMDLVKDVNFDQSFSFLYSKRPGTPAADIPDDTPIDVKKDRLKMLQDQLNHNANFISRQMVGSEQKVLVEGHSKKQDGLLSGRTDNNRFVNFEGDSSLIDTFITVKITDAQRHSLTGYIV
jgi:tRNA-2-methylthio-N6-dimethylallyladenosine synthase